MWWLGAAGCRLFAGGWFTPGSFHDITLSASTEEGQNNERRREASLSIPEFGCFSGNFLCWFFRGGMWVVGCASAPTGRQVDPFEFWKETLLPPLLWVFHGFCSVPLLHPKSLGLLHLTSVVRQPLSRLSTPPTTQTGSDIDENEQHHLCSSPSGRK